jgi:hypothetical protein
VQVAGSPSWRFGSDVSDSLLVALYVRDVNGLNIPASGDVPPLLDGPLSVEVSGASAEAQWRDWWNALLDLWLASERHPSDLPRTDVRVRMRRRMAAWREVYDPPEFGSLVGSPELRALLRSGFAAANHWASQRRQVLVSDGREQFDYEIIGAVAESVARVHGVSPGAVCASAQVLPVSGLWWRRVRPGAVLCSVAAARDEDSARVLLRDAFESRLAD